MRPHSLTHTDLNPKKRFRLSTAADDLSCADGFSPFTPNLNARYDRLSREAGVKKPSKKSRRKREINRKLSKVSEQMSDLDMNPSEERTHESHDDTSLRPLVTPTWFKSSSMPGSKLISDGYRMPTPLTSPRSTIPFSEPHIVEPYTVSARNYPPPLSLRLSTSPYETLDSPHLHRSFQFSQDQNSSSDPSWSNWASSPLAAEQDPMDRLSRSHLSKPTTSSQYPTVMSFGARFEPLRNSDPLLSNKGPLSDSGDDWHGMTSLHNSYQGDSFESEFDKSSLDRLAPWPSQMDDNISPSCERLNEDFELSSYPTSENIPFSKPHTMTDYHWMPTNSSLPHPLTLPSLNHHIVVPLATRHQSILSRNRLAEDHSEVVSPFETVIPVELNAYPEPPLTPELIRHLQRLSSEEARSPVLDENLEQTSHIPTEEVKESSSVSAPQPKPHLRSFPARPIQLEESTLKPFFDDMLTEYFTINEDHQYSPFEKENDALRYRRRTRSHSVLSSEYEK